MNKIVIGVHNNISDKEKSYQEHVKAITYFSLLQLRSYHNYSIPEIIERNDIDSIIEKASTTEAHWLFLTSYGLRIKDFDIINKSIRHAEESKSGIIGHPLQVLYNSNELGENEFLIHPQCLLLNLRTWEKIGKPKFGKSQTGELKKHIPLRSNENMHDNYTPYWIKSSNTYEDYSGFLGTGWSLIQAAMEHQEPIFAFPQSTVGSKLYLYPELENKELEGLLNGDVDEEEFIKRNLNSNNAQANYITETSFKHHSPRVYIYNTDKIENDDIVQSRDNSPLKNLYSVASGFKALTLLKQSNWDSNTKVVFYDYSKASLNLKKWLLQNWDGKDYVEILKHYKENAVCECCDAPITSIYQWNREVDIYEDEELLRKRFDEIVKYFGGMKSWLTFWKRFKTLEIEFLVCNLLGDFNSLSDHVQNNKGNSLIWLSNIFYSEPIIRNFKPNVVEEKYNILINELKKGNPDLEAYGSIPLTEKIYENNTQ